MKAIRETLYLIVIMSGIISELLHIGFINNFRIDYAITPFAFMYFFGTLIIIFFGKKQEYIHYPYWFLMVLLGVIHDIFKLCGVDFQNKILVYMDSGLCIALLIFCSIKYEELRKR
jgi:hypothetical protein